MAEKNVISILAFFYGEDITEEEKETAGNILEANAVNYDGRVKEVRFYRTAEELKKSQAWVFAFPLYIDGIPAHLLSCLMQLEKACTQNSGISKGTEGYGDRESHKAFEPHDISVYAIVNCGFYEGSQTKHALRLMENWCIRTGAAWGGGIGIGGGGALAMMPDTPSGKGPKAPVNTALCQLANRILKQESGENSYVSVAFPRFLYKLCG